MIYKDPVNAKQHFNNGVQACLNYCEQKCGGPIPRIKNYLSNNFLGEEIITTADGSSTILFLNGMKSYHSKHGAIQEAYHVFIKNGFSLFEGKPFLF